MKDYLTTAGLFAFASWSGWCAVWFVERVVERAVVLVALDNLWK